MPDEPQGLEPWTAAISGLGIPPATGSNTAACRDAACPFGRSAQQRIGGMARALAQAEGIIAARDAEIAELRAAMTEQENAK